MTVIYTETHLTSDPIFLKDTAIFNIALSSITVQCQVHREENLIYIKKNQLRTGDLIRLHGVFLTETEPNKGYYIKISSMALMTPLKLGKKRKIEEAFMNNVDSVMQSALDDSIRPQTQLLESASLSSASANDSQASQRPSVMSTSNASGEQLSYSSVFVEVEGDFSEYFFMLYGKAHYVCQCLMEHIQGDRQTSSSSEVRRQLEACQMESTTQLYHFLGQIYELFIELARQGLNKLSVLHYVNTVKCFVDKLNDLQKSFHHVLPYGLVIDHRVPLPSVIYNFYAQVV
ncbi:MAG: hypothetical protein EXX96DRAFT_571863 [Benjaminiella poitrasii]|nr:MAG: hypothetical protein EXX96DRAFT_571863 [Benjaminiella poitrasii]